MCVGAPRPRVPRSALLFLGFVLGTAAQLRCSEHSYPHGDRCCRECQPGYGMESRCTDLQDTLCVPCKPGFYNEYQNYDSCRPCTQCNQRSGSETKQMCTAKQDTICRCRPGTQPQDGFKHGSGPELAAVLGVGLGLGLLAPAAAALILLLHCRAWRLLPPTKPPAEDCPEGTCVCVQPEFHCGDPQCKSCKHHPCPPGQRVRAHGKFTFGFDCVDCAAGTFSGGHGGHCEPWANCSQAGFRTMFPGNRTHDAVCGHLLPPPAERHCLLSVSLLAVAACILVLAVVQLGLHIWQLRRQRLWLPETQMLLEAPPAEDACSCQFPEEERGEQLAGDKGCGEQLAEDKGDLWV
ncbi:Tumor necrosis factor receptor superfamily member 18 [Pteropus alecto]|uniref:Tumor necrosis factor receptor superfamily member 18 n=1 Tax=Pteropus alecto TaxID=9402 RepID=L5L749_PTEAL|nr:Tumor necrosis factor receptor superfamily member 18 [Pteropus alecto]